MNKLSIFEHQRADYYFMFGYYSLTGKNNTKIDYEVAFNCFMKAANLENVAAMYYLGLMYIGGYNININYEEAEKWLKMAADNDYMDAIVDLGKLYLKLKKYALAEFWLTKAANLEDERAMYYLGLMYKNGNAIVKNVKLANYWFEESFENGFSFAKKELIKTYSN